MFEGAAAQWSLKRDERDTDFAAMGRAYDLPMGDLVRAIDEGLRGHVSLLTQAMETASYPRQRGEQELRRPLDLIHRECLQLADALDDVREIGRLVDGGVLKRRDPIRLAELLDEVLDQARPTLEARSVRVVKRIPQPPLWIEVEQDRFARTLAGLLDRIIQRANPGAELVLTAVNQGDGLLLHVQLMSMNPAPVRAEPRRPPDLELILARCLMRGLGGHFSLGESLRLWLPLSARAEGLPNRSDILIIDRSREAARSLGRLLAETGCRVRMCAGLDEAAGALASRCPDVLLFDLELAAELGIAADRWAATALSRGTPPIILGLGEVPDGCDSLSGFRDVLPRPIRLEQLRRYLEASRPQSASA